MPLESLSTSSLFLLCTDKHPAIYSILCGPLEAFTMGIGSNEIILIGQILLWQYD